MMAKQRRTERVREPIQVYLTSEERALLDRLARETGLSRAEVLRRGLRTYALEAIEGRSPVFDYLLSLQGDDWPADVPTRHDEHLADVYEDPHDR